MLNFTLGPVQMDYEIRQHGIDEIPYFRTAEFSHLMKENEKYITKFMDAPIGSRAIFLTASGTAAMEATVINLFDCNDKLLIVNGGSFGARFVKICEIYGIPFTEIKIEMGKQITIDNLKKYAGGGYTGFLIQADETSSGVLFDMELIGNFCKRENIILVVDAISSFLCDYFSMQEYNIDVAFISSQKALAIPPGISSIVVNSSAIYRINNNKVKTLYFDFKDYLKNGERGQTPYTPAVGIIMQMYERFKQIEREGVANIVNHSRELAEDFRKRILELPFEILFEDHSNAHTPIHPIGKNKTGEAVDAYHIFELLKDNYEIFVCPVGGDWASRMFRVGHLGALTVEDNTKLLSALSDLHAKGEL
jgi:aspartate aminotransferase-like enzyme